MWYILVTKERKSAKKNGVRKKVQQSNFQKFLHIVLYFQNFAMSSYRFLENFYASLS